MARDFAKSFYNSKKWKRCRALYLSVHPYCERCLARGIVTPAEHVHHKVYIDTPEKVNDPFYSLNADNLEALCEPCHSREHNARPDIREGLLFDEEGNIVSVLNSVPGGLR